MKQRLLIPVVIFLMGIWLLPTSAFAQTYLNFTVNQTAPPTVSFTAANVSGSTFAFTGTSSSSNVSWFWDFGDGNVDSIQNPLYTYSVSGNYNVCLTVTDANNCTTTDCQPIIAVGIDEIPFVRDFSIHPNPFQSSAKISYHLDEFADVEIELLDVMGKQIRLIAAGEQTPGSHIHQLEGDLPAGVYFVSLRVNDARLTRRIVHTR